jgi:hypothetical protein
MSTRVHLCISVRGMMSQEDKHLRGVFSHDGMLLTPRMARKYLQYQLAMGKEKLPIGEPCEGFDYKTGCPGHEEVEIIAPGSAGGV